MVYKYRPVVNLGSAVLMATGVSLAGLAIAGHYTRKGVMREIRRDIKNNVEREVTENWAGARLLRPLDEVPDKSMRLVTWSDLRELPKLKTVDSIVADGYG